MSRLFLYIAAIQMIKNMKSEELKQKIEQVTENWSFTKYNLMRMGTLVKLIDEVEAHAPACTECKSFQHELVGYNPRFRPQNRYSIPYTDTIL